MSVRLLLTLAAWWSASATAADQQDRPVSAVRGLIQRLIPDHAAQFQLHMMHAGECHAETKLCFGYAAGTEHGTVQVAGTYPWRGPSPYVAPPYSLRIARMCETVRYTPVLNTCSDVCGLGIRHQRRGACDGREPLPQVRDEHLG